MATNEVDFEYGFALKNQKGEVWYEIGANPAPLFGENCAQMYGSFYNRIAPNDEHKQFVFGDCAHACPADWRDEVRVGAFPNPADCFKPLCDYTSH